MIQGMLSRARRSLILAVVTAGFALLVFAVIMIWLSVRRVSKISV